MKNKFLKVIASLLFFVSFNCANQASWFTLYNPSLPKKVKDLRKI